MLKVRKPVRIENGAPSRTVLERIHAERAPEPDRFRTPASPGNQVIASRSASTEAEPCRILPRISDAHDFHRALNFINAVEYHEPWLMQHSSKTRSSKDRPTAIW